MSGTPGGSEGAGAAGGGSGAAGAASGAAGTFGPSPAPARTAPAPPPLRRARVAGASGTRPFGRWRPTPYFVFGGLLWIGITLAAWAHPVCCDAGQHAAVVERLKAGLFHPAHPMADLPGAGSPYYSPYALAQALFAKATGSDGWTVFRLAAPVNLLVLLLGLNAFVKQFSRRPWAPVLALVFLVTLWGTDPLRWSGFLGLLSLVSVVGYPSTFAMGLALAAWAVAARLTSPEREYPATAWAKAGLGLLCGLILLIHAISAVAAVAGVAVLVLTRWRGWTWRAAAGWALVPLAAVVAGAVWPYFGVFSLGSASDVLDPTHRPLYRDLVGRYWLVALVGLPALALRLRRDRRDPLAWMFLVFLVVACYGGASGHFTYGRILGMTVVVPQVAAALELTSSRPRRWWRTAYGAAAALAVCLGFLFAQAGAVLPASALPKGGARPPDWPSYAWAAEHVRPGEPLLTVQRMATRSLPGFGVDMAAPVWSDPALAERDRAARWRAARAYVSGRADAARRAAIVRRYHVRWLLLSRWQRLPAEAVVVDWSRETGEVLARVSGGGGERG
ncbi:hypothetical protein [Streptomyces sp. NPDC007088]|uniref:hypothetical protein n=1 Tax=Streptomyces sp. NPDC007088 TaxID=3364773 RepID=UPI0036CE2F4F